LPNGDIYRKSFKIFNDIKGLSYLIEEIRKVENDKKDELAIAKIGKYQNTRKSDYLDVNIFAINSLCRDYYYTHRNNLW